MNEPKHNDPFRIIFDQLSAVENQVYTRMKAAAADWSKLTEETVVYFGNLASKWRELTLNTFAPRA